MRSTLCSGALLLVVALGVACGYGLAGRTVSLPDHVKTIAVTSLTNRTAQPGLDQTLTDAVRRELQGRGRWRVVPDASDPGVDAVLSGTINAIQLIPTAQNQGQATRVNVSVVSGLELRDLRNNNKVLWANPGLVTVDEYPISAGTSLDPSAFLRQNQDAYQRIAQKFARTVVSTMLEGM
jgi:outer membrane lipopolysaccharide assembly protein LptE/RlpB